jgi:tripartite ATP-independent transporter DctP family solute receptor
MITLKRFLVCAACFVCLVFGSSLALAQQNYVLRLGHNNAVTHPVNLTAEYFAKNVKEKSNGRLEIQVYPAAQLGDERQLGEAVQIGTVDIMYGQTPMFGRFVKEFNGLEGGYLFRDIDHMMKVMQSPIGKNELNQKLIEGMKVRALAYTYAGTRHLTTTDKAVQHPADLKGLLIRVPQLDTYMATWKALGASTTGIAFNETYMALKMGVAKGQENPIPSIYAMKFHEVQKYLVFTGHAVACGVWSMNNAKFLSLPKDLQDVLQAEAARAIEYAQTLFVNQEKDLLPELKKYMTFVEVDKAEWQKAAQQGGMDEWFAQQLGADLYKRILETK